MEIHKMDILLICLATATTNLDSNSFPVRHKSEAAIRDCGIFAGAHVEAGLNSPSLEVRNRCKRLWLEMPDFYARYMLHQKGCVQAEDFHMAAVDRCGGAITSDYMIRLWEQTEKEKH